MKGKGLYKEAVLWEPTEDGAVDCNLCNFRCHIKAGKFGSCRVRKNVDGKLYSLNYYNVCSAGVDPIEKKPLFHFLPGSKSFSIACPGCNFKCEFCQNWQISQVDLEKDLLFESRSYSPKSIVNAALESGCKSIAYTYTEPTIFMELASECGKLAHKKGLKNVFVSNGYMTTEAIDFVRPWLDGINVDLKAFSEDYYRTLCKAHLQPILDNIKYICESTSIWLELTTLVVPGHNDSDREMKELIDFVAGLKDGNVPWHISRFYPNYKMDNLAPTPETKMLNIYNLAKKAGIKYVYMGNLICDYGQDTKCLGCDEKIIERSRYHVVVNRAFKGCCSNCGREISGFFEKI